jgi:hypothetical protein
MVTDDTTLDGYERFVKEGAMRILILVFFGLATYANLVIAAEENRRPVQIVRFESAPAIDGHLNEAIWKQATPLRNFHQTHPGDNTRPTFATEALLAYSGKHFFIGIRSYDEKKNIRATLAKRDDISADDSISIYLDTFHDQRKAYVLMFNPFGVQQDGIFNEDGVTDYSVDVVMESRGVHNY